MGFFQSPKTLLSSSIATALSDYFVVDVTQIESNLLNDTKIVLQDVTLKPQLSSIPTNTFGTQTNICVTGCVQEVSFTWSWEAMNSESESWVKDAVLKITGCTFKATLTEEDITEDDNKNWKERDNHNKHDHQSNSSSEKETAAGSGSGGGGSGRMNAYLTKQIEMVLDALTLTILDFEMTIEMPSPTVAVAVVPMMGNKTSTSTKMTTTTPTPAPDDDPNHSYTVSFVLGGKQINIVSLGRSKDTESEEALQEKISFSSLFLNVMETFHDKTIPTSTTYPLHDPFSYHLEVIRTHGKRFGGMERGLVVKGGGGGGGQQQQQLQELNVDVDEDTTNTNTATDDKMKKKGQLSFYLARPQMEGIGQLSGLLLAPQRANNNNEVGEMETATQEIISSNNDYKSNGNDDDDDENTLVGDVSTFDFSINGASVDFMGDIVALTHIDVYYVMDGTECTIQVETFRYTEQLPTQEHNNKHKLPQENENETTTSIIVSKIVASLRPTMDVTIGSIHTMCIPGVIVLRAPMEKVQATLIGDTWTFRIDILDALLPAVGPSSTVEENESSEATTTQPPPGSSSGHSSSSLNLTLVLPPGPLGISIGEDSQGCCRVREITSTNNNNVFQVGDVIDSLNGQQLRWKGGVQQWKQLFQHPNTNTASPSHSTLRHCTVTRARAICPTISTTTSSSSNFMIPFPLSCNITRMRLIKEEDQETEITIEGLEILMNPKRGDNVSSNSNNSNCTEVACSVARLESKLVRATNINTCMALPAAKEVDVDVNTIRNFTLSMDRISVTAGYSIQDWTQTFGIGGKWTTPTSTKANNNTTSAIHIPNASVSPLKISIAYNAMNVVSVKETTFIVKTYKGNESTSIKNVIDFYIAECLHRTPHFISNAELLGINVENAGAFSLGAVLFGVSGPIGPFVGVAAVVGVDAVRGSIEAGKRSRNAKEGEQETHHLGDFFRGIGYSAVEATRQGKLRRGYGNGNDDDDTNHQDGNSNILFDWVVGASVNTSDYIGTNKETLGSAGGAGAGILVGTLLGGPVGAVIGGVVGGMTTGTAIRKLDHQ